VYELEPEADTTATLPQEQEEQQEEQGPGEQGDVVPEAAVRSGTQSPTTATTRKKASVAKKVVKSATQTKAKGKKAAKAAKKPEPPAAAQEELDEGEETRRLAVCKCDWDKVRAVDILVLLQSFVPATGAIVAVTIYPSRLGQQRLDEEVTSLPPLVPLSILGHFPSRPFPLSFLLSCSWWVMGGSRRVKAKHGPQGIFRDRRQGRGATGEIDDGKLRQYEARHRHHRPLFLEDGQQLASRMSC
jgi:hypothetical protein